MQDLRKTRALLGSVILILLVVIGGLVAWIESIQSGRNNKQLAAAAALVPVPELGIHFEAHEVTNERYWACIEEEVCVMPVGFLEVRASWPKTHLMPVVNVQLAEALQFCQWIGRTLPTYAQWTAVAPLETWQSYGPDQALLCRDGSDCEDATLMPVPVSSKPQYISENMEGGIFDLVGSVEEWTRTTIVDRNPVDIGSLAELSGGQRPVVVLGHHYRVPLLYVGAYPDFPLDSTDSSTGGVLRGFRCVEQ